MVISPEGRRFRKAVTEEILYLKLNHKLTKKLRVDIEAFRPDNRRRDLDNLLKSVLDALTHAGVYEDDHLICDLRIHWGEGVKKKLNVTIEEIEDEHGGEGPAPSDRLHNHAGQALRQGEVGPGVHRGVPQEPEGAAHEAVGPGHDRSSGAGGIRRPRVQGALGGTTRSDRGGRKTAVATDRSSGQG